MVESTMKRYPHPKDLGSWGYAKSLYLYGQYLVYKRTNDPRYLKYIKDWIDYARRCEWHRHKPKRAGRNTRDQVR